MSEVESRLEALGLKLPEPTKPAANYVGAVRTGNLIYLSGHGPRPDPERAFIGKVGADLNVDRAYDAARAVMLNCLSTLKAEIGDLDRVRRVVKVLGMVNSAPGFGEQPKVINGASDLLVDLFGDRGRHARSAVGMAELPVGIAVEIEMIVEVEEEPTAKA
jgi:enamine deaminase RidA (YjgF/YER057c/UK114 family)